MIGHVAPEAALGGPIAAGPGGRHDRHRRRPQGARSRCPGRRAGRAGAPRWIAPPPRYTGGVMAKYAALVSSASDGRGDDRRSDDGRAAPGDDRVATPSRSGSRRRPRTSTGRRSMRRGRPAASWSLRVGLDERPPDRHPPATAAAPSWEALTPSPPSPTASPGSGSGTPSCRTRSATRPSSRRRRPSLDHVTGGRFILGLGAGWYDGEHDAVRDPVAADPERFDRVRIRRPDDPGPRLARRRHARPG